MAWVQRNTPPPNKILNFSLKDFSGGMNNRSDQIKDNEGSQVINLKFADDTILETRYGQKYYNDIQVDDEIVFLDLYRPYDDDDILIYATNTTMYLGDIEISIDGVPSGFNHLGRYYFCDGKNIRVYGIFLEDEGTYTKIIGSRLNSYIVMDVVSPPSNYEQLDESHKQGVKVINFTNKTIHYEPCKNEFENPYIGANVLPSNAKYIVSHDGRLYLSGNDKDDDKVYITDVDNPLYYPATLPLQLPPTSSKIRGMHVFDDSVVVGREDDIYVISGKTNNPELGFDVMKVRRLNTHTGFASHQAIDIAHNYLIFLGSDGNVYALQNTKTYERDLATIILSRTINLNAPPINLQKEDYSSATSIFYDDEWLLSIKGAVLVYSYRHMSWVLYNGLKARSFEIVNSDLVWGNGDGRFATWDKENYLDFDKPYQSYWYSKPFDMDDANSFKQFREFFLVAHTFSNYFSDIYVTFEVDYANVKNRAIISNQISRWGYSKFGDRFINKNINESLPFIIGRRGRNIRFKVTNGYVLDGEVETLSDLNNYLGKKDGMLIRVLDIDEYYLYFEYKWNLLDKERLNQRMKIYQINGDYELRGKR